MSAPDAIEPSGDPPSHRSRGRVGGERVRVQFERRLDCCVEPGIDLDTGSTAAGGSPATSGTGGIAADPATTRAIAQAYSAFFNP